MHADLEAVRGYDPGYDADAGSARLAASLAVASSAAALSGVLPKAVSAWGWTAIKASTWGPVALALSLGAGGAVATIVVSHGGESVASRQPGDAAAREKIGAKVAAKLAREEISQVSRGGTTVAPPLPLEELPPEPVVEVERAVRPLPARRPARPPAKLAERGRSIRDEVREVATLRELLATHPAKALAGVDDRRGSTGSTLDEERAILAMEALVALGRTAEASERARAFLLAHPASAYAARARSLLGG